MSKRNKPAKRYRGKVRLADPGSLALEDHARDHLQERLDLDAEHDRADRARRLPGPVAMTKATADTWTKAFEQAGKDLGVQTIAAADLRDQALAKGQSLLETELAALEMMCSDWDDAKETATAARNLPTKIPPSFLMANHPRNYFQGRFGMIRAALEYAITTDPLYLSQVDARGEIHYRRGAARVTTARQALIERLLILWAVLDFDADQVGQALFGGDPDDLPFAPALLSLMESNGPGEAVHWARESMVLSVVLRGLDAPLFLWSEAMRQMAAAYTLPPHVISSELVSAPAMWWVPEVDITQDWDPNYRVLGSLLMRRSDSLDVVHIVGVQALAAQTLVSDDGDPPPIIIQAQRIPYGARYPQDFPEGPERIAARAVLGMLAFMNSPYVEDRPARLSRVERRQVERQAKVQDQGDTTRNTIRTFHLRAAAPAERDAPSGDGKPEPSGRHVGVRFWVRGHYRAQWYRSLQAHKVIWIAPVLKGPADAPLKSPARKVYQVDR